MSSIVTKYNSASEFQDSLSLQIKNLEKKIDDYSKKMGEMLRTDKELSQDDPDVQQIKEQIEGTKNDQSDTKKKSNNKKKKSSKKKDAKWFDINGLYIYNGASATGELEVYFKAVESLKNELESLRKIKESLGSLIEKGLKEDLGCVVLQNCDSPPEIILMKNTSKSGKFAYNSIICVSCEPQKITLNRWKVWEFIWKN